MCSSRLRALCKSQFVSIGTPRPLRFHHLTAGLLARGYMLSICLPTVTRSGPAFERR